MFIDYQYFISNKSLAATVRVQYRLANSQNSLSTVKRQIKKL